MFVNPRFVFTTLIRQNSAGNIFGSERKVPDFTDFSTQIYIQTET